MFRALLCSSSGARDYMCVIAAYGGQCLVAGCRGSGAEQQGVRPGRGMLHDCSRLWTVPRLKRCLRPLSADAWVRSQVSPCKICCGKGGTSSRPSPSASFSLSVALHQWSILVTIYTSLLPEGKAEKVWKFSKNALSEIAVAQWLRCCATNQKVAGSIPDGVIGIFHPHNPSDRTMALGSTQPLTEMSTRRISWG